MTGTARRLWSVLSLAVALTWGNALAQTQDSAEESTVDTATQSSDTKHATDSDDQPEQVRPGNMKLELDVVRSGFDAGGGDSFEIGSGLQFNYIYSWKSWLGLEAGLYVTEKVKDEVREDIVGTYQVSLATRSLQLGLRPQHMYTQWRVYGRLGLLAYQTELEVEEFFNNNIPGGTVSADDDGTGVYFGFGATYFATRSITVQFEFLQMQQNDVFGGSTDRAFDLKINNLSLGIGYVF